jgi:hypothetical protein
LPETTETPIESPYREYHTINEFEIRLGRFYDPNEHSNGTRYEIRILHHDYELIEALRDKIKDVLAT